MPFYDKSTEWFIDDNPSDITVRRFSRVRQSDGSFKQSLVSTLPPQTGRLVEQAASNESRTIEPGDILVKTYIYVLPKTGDLQRDDRFFIGDREFLVQQITETPWSVEGVVTEYGS